MVNSNQTDFDEFPRHVRTASHVLKVHQDGPVTTTADHSTNFNFFITSGNGSVTPIVGLSDKNANKQLLIHDAISKGHRKIVNLHNNERN